MTKADTVDPVVRAKTNAALAALEFVKDGMVVGLGSGSTAEIFIAALGKRVKTDGWTIKGVPTSEASAKAARTAGIPLAPIDEVAGVDVDVDGADEVDPAFNLIKGGGGCLLREKIVAAASKQFVVIVDPKKRVPTLGAFPLPVEVDRFGWTLTAKLVEAALRGAGAGAFTPRRRAGKDGAPFVTDGGHYILDCAVGSLPDPGRAAAAIADLPGVVDHGLFLGLTSVLIVGEPDGAQVITA